MEDLKLLFFSLTLVLVYNVSHWVQKCHWLVHFSYNHEVRANSRHSRSILRSAGLDIRLPLAKERVEGWRSERASWRVSWLWINVLVGIGEFEWRKMVWERRVGGGGGFYGGSSRGWMVNVECLYHVLASKQSEGIVLWIVGASLIIVDNVDWDSNKVTFRRIELWRLLVLHWKIKQSIKRHTSQSLSS